MKTKPFFFLLAILIIVVACNSKSKMKNSHATAATDNREPVIRFADTDSIELYYYPQPQNQKEFKRFLIYDTAFIQALSRNLDLPPKANAACEHQLKMYLFDKGEVFKTIYAAPADSCNYLAYIVNGKPYFLPLQDSIKTTLNKLME